MNLKTKNQRTAAIIFLVIAVVVMAFVCLFIGSSHMTLKDGIAALMGEGSAANQRIIRNIRLPRVLAAVIAAAGDPVLSVVWQTAVFSAAQTIAAAASGFIK